MTLFKLFQAMLLLPVAALLAQTPKPSAAEALTAHLQNTPRLHVAFTQTRTLAALSRPLKTSGRLVLARELGVIWQVQKPLNLTYVVGPKGMMEVGPDGKAKKKNAKDVPMVAQMGRILQALLQGRWSALEEFFTLRAEGSSERWKIILVPKPQTATFLKGVQITGGRFIDRIHVDEPSGDAMDLVFDRPRPDEPLSDEEQRLFKFE
ncbi:MAG: outer membrane lipoprotein carrier protein LolA [Holophaga sp.]|nr:outer membrane lipoprotein carrier protein LolA [Holophaga sp.]